MTSIEQEHFWSETCVSPLAFMQPKT